MRPRKRVVYILRVGLLVGAAGIGELLARRASPVVQAPPRPLPKLGAEVVHHPLETVEGKRLALNDFVGKKAVLMSFHANY
jgi:hypothetical protein